MQAISQNFDNSRGDLSDFLDIYQTFVRFLGNTKHLLDFLEISVAVEAAEAFTSLDIDIENHASLAAALRTFLNDEETVSLESWACPRCGDTSAPAKRNSLHHKPEVLCVQLRRFRTDFRPGVDAVATHTYLKKHVHCEETLTIEDTHYSQCARIYHKGETLRTGHYYAICRHERPEGPWWYYNDRERRLARPEDDDASQARVYLALYAKDA